MAKVSTPFSITKGKDIGRSKIKVSKPPLKQSHDIVEKIIPHSLLRESQQNRKNISFSNNFTHQITEETVSNKIIKETNFSLSKKFDQIFNFKVFEGVLHVWDEKRGYFIPLSFENADMFFRKFSPEELKPYINSRNIKELVSWIKSECETNLNEADLFEHRNYLNFNNGMYNIKNHRFYKLSPSLNIRSKLAANFTDVQTDSRYFEKFMKDICSNDFDLYKRIQEFFGYVISEIRDIKIIIFLVGPKDSGKSIILKLLEYLIGNDFCTSLSLDELNKKEYLSRLLAKKLNTCGEVSEISLNRLDNLKKLSGGDKIMSKALYDQPVSFTNRAALVFAGNHLPEIKKLDKSNAFSDRLLIIPFTNQIPKEKQDPTLFNKLSEEIDYIANWALTGLLRLIENNYSFTESTKNQRIMENYKLQSNSIEFFIKNRCVQSHEYKIFKDDFERAYYQFCDENDVVPTNKTELHKYLKALPHVIFKRIRIGEDIKNGYVGIKFN